ncbi:MAG: gliding motility-associated C-terminal domain-containing protein, partial [Bacteroidota bacterium]
DSILLQVTEYPGYDYQWYRNDELLSTDLTRIFARTEATYEAEIIDPLGCTFVSEPADIAVFTPPTANFSLLDATCARERIEFQSNSSVDPDADTRYIWNFGNSEGGEGDSLEYVYPGRGDFIVSLFVSYEGVNNCEDVRNRPLRVDSAPQIEISNSADTLGLCPGDSLTLTITNSFTKFRWNIGSEQASATITSPGTYSVVAENVLGCTDTIAVQVDSLPLPELSITPTPDGGIVRGDSAQLEAEGGTFYLWEPDTGLSSDTSAIIWAFPATDTEYTLSALNEFGCFEDISYFLEVFPPREDPLPSAFSPNGDGIDDTWTLVNDLAFSDCRLTIINRNGSTVFFAESGYDNSWDGTYQGAPLPEGVYYYIFECPDGFTQSGAITLVR